MELVVGHFPSLSHTCKACARFTPAGSFDAIESPLGGDALLHAQDSRPLQRMARGMRGARRAGMETVDDDLQREVLDELRAHRTTRA
jgi:hypothetical protein